MTKTTIKEVAKQAELSTSTVSLALRDSSRVTDKTKEKVRSIAKRLHYKRNLLGRAFSLQKTDTIGLVVTDIANVMVATHVILLVEEIASKHGYHVILGNSQGILEKEVEYVNLLSQGKVDGMIIGSVQPNHQHIEELTSRNFPFALLDKYEDKRVNYIAFDDKKGAYLAVEHLIKSGHKRIAYISGPSMILTNKYKLDGYKQALDDYNLSFDDTLVVEGGYTPKDGYRAIGRLLKVKKRPAALFCFNDRVAVGVIKGLEEAGLKVPDDIAIVGFDNSEDEIFGLNVSLTTIALPQYERAKKATELILEKIEHPDKTREALRIDLEPELIIRESCGGSQAVNS